MPTDAPPRRMTAEEFLDLPDRKHIERMLIRGKLQERKMIVRSFWHSAVLAQMTFFLQLWNRTKQPFRARSWSATPDFGFWPSLNLSWELMPQSCCTERRYIDTAERR